MRFVARSAALLTFVALVAPPMARAEGDEVLGPTQVVDPMNGVILLELAPGKRPVKAAVAPGRYLLQHRLGENTLVRELNLEPGKTLFLEEDALTLTAKPELAGAGEVSAKSGKFTSFVPAIIVGAIALALAGGGAGFESWSSRSANSSTSLQTTADVFFAGGGLAAIVAGILTVIPIVNR